MRGGPDLPGAAFIAAWAGAISRFWELGLAAGRIDPAREVVVLEADAGDGQLAWRLHEALGEQMGRTLAAGLHIRQFACAPTAARAAALREHLGWRGMEALHWPGGGMPEVAGNPLVILACRYFAGRGGAALEPLSLLARGRYLLLAAEPEAALPPPEPGALAWRGRAGAGDLASAAYLRDQPEPAREETLAAIVAGLEGHQPRDHRALARLLRAARPLEPAAVLTALRLSGFDPRVLVAGLDALEERPAPTQDPLRLAWREALARVWQRQMPRAGRDDLGPRLARLAMAWGHWDLAAAIWRLEAASRSRPGGCLRQLERCRRHAGGAD